MKIARIEAEFAELKGDNRVSGKGEASTVRAAISRAVADLFKQPALRSKRISTINMTVTLTNKVALGTVLEEDAVAAEELVEEAAV